MHRLTRNVLPRRRVDDVVRAVPRDGLLELNKPGVRRMPNLVAHRGIGPTQFERVHPALKVAHERDVLAALNVTDGVAPLEDTRVFCAVLRQPAIRRRFGFIAHEPGHGRTNRNDTTYNPSTLPHDFSSSRGCEYREPSIKNSICQYEHNKKKPSEKRAFEFFFYSLIATGFGVM